MLWQVLVYHTNPVRENCYSSFAFHVIHCRGEVEAIAAQVAAVVHCTINNLYTTWPQAPSRERGLCGLCGHQAKQVSDTALSCQQNVTHTFTSLVSPQQAQRGPEKEHDMSNMNGHGVVEDVAVHMSSTHTLLNNNTATPRVEYAWTTAGGLRPTHLKA